MHPEGWHHTLLSQVQCSQAPGGDRHGGTQGIKEVFHIIIEFLELARFLQLMRSFHILHNSVILGEKEINQPSI